MKLRSFKDWFASQESSAFTRSRNAAFWGTGPKIASPFSHSTPPPGMVDKLLSDIDEDDDKKKKKKKEDKKDENHGRRPDYSFDAFVRKMQQTKKDIDKDIEAGDQSEKELEKQAKDKQDKEDREDKSKKPIFPFQKKKPQDEEKDEKDNLKDKKPAGQSNPKVVK